MIAGQISWIASAVPVQDSVSDGRVGSVARRGGVRLFAFGFDVVVEAAVQ